MSFQRDMLIEMENQAPQREISQQIEAASTTIGTLVSLGRMDLAEDVARSIYEKDTSDVALKDFYASALYRMKRKIPLAASLALEAYRQRPYDMNRLQGTARCLMLAGRAPEAERLVREALVMNPGNLELLVELSYLLTFQGNFDSAHLILKNMVAENPRHLVAHFHLGWHDVFTGHHEDGFVKQLLGRRIWIWGAHASLPVEACWDGISPFGGDHVYLIGEGGVGDQIMTFGMANSLAERTKKKVVLVVRPELFALAKRSVASSQIDVVVDLPRQPTAPWVGGLEFGKLISPGVSPFPVGDYLKPDPVRVAKWKVILRSISRARVVGIRWSGDQNHELEAHRGLPVDEIETLMKSKSEISFVPIYAEKEQVEFPNGTNVISLGEPIVDWEDTIALLSLLDGVVSSCTSTAHASAALGKKTWVLSPIWPYYVWAQPQESSYWYGDHVKVLRQQKYRDWRAPFTRLRELL